MSFSFVMDICNSVRLDTGVLVISEYFSDVLWHWRFVKVTSGSFEMIKYYSLPLELSYVLKRLQVN